MNSILAKFKGMKKEQEFVLYPDSTANNYYALQSDNYCVIVRKDNLAVGIISKRFAQYPRFAFCDTAFGGRNIPVPNEVQEQITANVVTGPRKLITLVYP